MILKKILMLILVGLCSLFAENKTKRITFEHTQGKSPFKYASLGKMVWFSDSNDYLAIGKGNYLNSIVKISFLDNDTSILIDSSLLVHENKKISIDDMKLDSKGKKYSSLPMKKKYGDIPFMPPILLLRLSLNRFYLFLAIINDFEMLNFHLMVSL